MRKISLILSASFFLLAPGFSETIIDSSWVLSLWAQEGHRISYSPLVDAILIANRALFNYSINAHSAPGNLSYWVHDNYIYNLQFGRPHWCISTLASTNPYIGFGAALGYKAIAQRCVGWFTGNWEDPVNIGPDTAGVFMNIPLQLQDGNILFIALTVDSIIYFTRSPDLQIEIAHGKVADNFFWGADVNNGIVYVFYYDESANVYYRTTVDGINWSPEQAWTIVWPNPYPNNIIGFVQMAVTDAGNPLLVFDNWNGDDYNNGLYPWHSKVYVSYQSGQPCIEVSSTFGAPDTECIYPTIATGGNYAAVLYCMPRNNEPDALNWWDFYVVWSSDNGQTWGTPINYTGSLTNRPGLPQLAKRIDTLRNRAYYIYAIDMVRNIDPLWNVWISGDYDPIYIYFDYAQYTGIEEGEKLRAEGKELKLMVLPNVIRDYAQIQCAIPERQRISLNLYDIIGRKVKTIAQGTIEPGVYSYRFDSSNLMSGIYFLILSGVEDRKVQKVLILR
ncbi:MAG: hypothetical protein ABIL40_01820 [candidate division WOR-3 bacterium]